MKESALPTPGVGSRSQHLRRLLATTISSLEVTAPKYTTGQHPSAAALVACLEAALVAAKETGKLNTVPTFVTAGGLTTVAPLATLATTLTKGGSAGAVTYTTSDAAVATVSGAGLITGVAAGTVTITASIAATATYRAATISVTITVA